MPRNYFLRNKGRITDFFAIYRSINPDFIDALYSATNEDFIIQTTKCNTTNVGEAPIQISIKVASHFQK